MQRLQAMARTMVYRAPEGGGGAGSGAAGGSGTPPEGGAGGTPPATWEAWQATLAPEHRALIDQHFDTRTQGLKSALESEREGKKAMEKQLRDAAAKAEAGSAAQAELTKLADEVQSSSARLEEATRRAVAYEVLASAGCSNVKLAYLAAVDADAFAKDGRVDVETLRKSMPELFRAGQRGDAGEGNGQPGAGADMNRLIRAAAGRG